MSKPKIELMTDSGAYSAWTQGKPVNLTEYTDFVLANPETIAHVVNLDSIDPTGPEVAAATGWANLCYMKDRGVDPLPVYHARERLDWFDKMLDTCKYIGISGTSLVSPTEHLAFYDLSYHYGTDSQGYPLAKYHAFGDTAPHSMLTYPWFSADSVSKESLILVRQAGRIRVETIEELYYSAGTKVQVTKDGHKVRELFDIETLVPVAGTYCWYPISSVIRHELLKKQHSVRVTSGKRIKITEDHSLFLDDQLDSQIVSVKDLVPKSTCIVSCDPELGAIRSEEITQLILDIPQCFYQRNSGCRTTTTRNLPKRIVFDSRFCEFLGLWLADGCFDGENRIQISAANDQECKHVIEDIALRYNKKVEVSKNLVDAQISSTILVKITMKLFDAYQNTSETKEMPWWVFQLPEDKLCAILRGYFSGDGSADHESITSSSVSSKLNYAVSLLLSSLGMRTSQSEWSNGYKTQHGTSIHDKVSRQIFMDKIAFLQERKNSIVRKALSSNTNDRKYCVDTVKRVKVEEIIDLGKRQEPVYDLSIPRIERFVANGILVHNSATWMLMAGRAGAVKLGGKSYNIHSKKVRDNNYIHAGLSGPAKQSWEEECRGLGLNPDKLFPALETATASMVAMIRSYMVAADILRLKARAVDVDRFRKPSTLISSKKLNSPNNGQKRIGPANIYFVISPSAYNFNFPVIHALGIKHVLVSYFYVTREKPIFWEERLKPFLYDPLTFCESDPKTKKFWEKLQEVLLVPLVKETHVSTNSEVLSVQPST